MEPLESISDQHRFGGVLAALGALLTYWRFTALPNDGQHSVDRAICLVMAGALAAYAWAVFVAALARSRGWSPQICRGAGYPLLALAAFGVIGGSRAYFDMGGWLVLGEMTGRVCRYIAFPELGWTDKKKGHTANQPAAGPPPIG